MTSVFPRRAAVTSAVVPSFNLALAVAPRSSSRRTFAMSPVAHMSAVAPPLLDAFTPAPASIRTRKQSGSAKAAAYIKAVAPMSSRVFGSAPDLSNTVTERVSLPRTASNSRVSAPAVPVKISAKSVVKPKAALSNFACFTGGTFPSFVRRHHEDTLPTDGNEDMVVFRVDGNRVAAPL